MKLARPRFPRAVRTLVFAAATSVTAVDCTLDVGVNTPSTIVKQTGDTQSAPPNTQLPVPFTIIVVNQNGEMLHNVSVTWSIASGGGSLSETSNKTNEAGLSSTTYTTGPTAGAAAIQASVHGIPPLTFNVTITQ